MATKTERKNEWNQKKYKRLQLVIKADEEPGLKAYADKQGKSINRLFLESFIHVHPGILSLLDDESRKKKTAELEAASSNKG